MLNLVIFRKFTLGLSISFLKLTLSIHITQQHCTVDVWELKDIDYQVARSLILLE